jgi:hypothetical protein
MKPTAPPPLRMTPDLRAAAESVLKEGESLSSFVEMAVRKQIEVRRVQREFIAGDLAAREDARRTGMYYTAEQSMAALDALLQKHKPGSA